MVSKSSGPLKPAYTPRSLEHPTNRMLWPDAVWMFRKIRKQCDDAGFVSPQDDGLAAVEYIAHAALEAIRMEREALQQPARKEPRRKNGPHERTKELVRDWDKIYPSEKKIKRASKADIEGWIVELYEDLRKGKTKSGEIIGSELDKQIRKYIEQLEKRCAALRHKKSIKDIREETAEAFVKTGYYGHPGPHGEAVSYIDNKLKKGRKSLRKGATRQPQPK
jgi:hypothetical protein